MLTKENLEKSILEDKEEKTSRRAREEMQHKVILINLLLEYATKKYECHFPEGFAEYLYKNAYQKNIPSKMVVDAIAAEWNIWKPYLLVKSFNSFMKTELEGVFRNQVATTFGSSRLKGYIGNKAIVVKEPPRGLTTNVFANGILRKNGIEIVFPKTNRFFS